MAMLLAVLHGCAARSHPAPPAPAPLPSPRTEAPPESAPGQPRPYKALGKWYRPIPDANGFRQQGLASWYGPDFHGKRASSGEIYDMHAMTAAHRTLPIGTLVRVRQLENNRTIEVRINDRGPFVRERERIIDLSYAAAARLGYVSNGSTRVRVESLDPEAYDTQGEALPDGVFLQIGAFARADNAQQLVARLARELALDPERTRVVLRDRLHRVQLGPYDSDDEALADRARVRERLDLNAVLVRRDG